MRILQIISGKEVNGAVIHCLMLTRGLRARGHDVHLLCRHDAWIAQQLRTEGVPIIESDLRRWPLTEFRRIREYVRAREIDVLHTHMTRAHHFGVLLRRYAGVPCVATAHADILQLHWIMNDHVIAVSKATEDFHRRWNRVPRERITTIWNFIDYARMANVPADEHRRVRESLNIAETETLIGVVGDITARKGQLYMVRALPRILKNAAVTRLLLVGKECGAYAQRVRAEAHRLGVEEAIVWTGLRSDVPEVMAALDLYVSPSVVEPFGMVVAEAMAAGLPVVATAVGGVPEFVLPEETGVLVRPRDPDALADTVLDLLRRPEPERRAMGARAKELVRTRFTVESQTPRIEVVLESVASQARPKT